MPAVRSPSFALNHMVAPSLRPDAFFALCRKVGAAQAEIRNDLAGNAIIDGTPAAEIGSQARDAEVSLISINALQRFNDWTPAREAEAIELADYAKAAGAAALVLVPVNDGSGRADGERQQNIRTALRALKSILRDRGVLGLVEPLGFAACSLRSKHEAAEAITDIDGIGAFKLVHDTFHHHLAGEPALFADMTGLVHISGVTDKDVQVDDMRDPHRVLVDENDRLDNVGQIRTLLSAGYAGPLSFEPFSPAVHTLEDPTRALADSIAFIRARL
ncbi:TIM barrel protein [Allomesorhizobium camelthorni]|uniref:TIM barrel protein n=1 Tax=Allomesorhizobium camelthorni TaxID=475069 RepID=A0A6G4WCW2_9HYPH|nr:TIM barrel protein [Mesorhizobium camelthorni]NGO52076.1 TIM barrel protein [Mesorhizobium camelthorni]